MLDTQTLDLFYRDAIRDHPNGKLRFLAKWCGSTYDLAANYEARDVLRMAIEIEKLLRTIGKYDGSEPIGDRDYQVDEIVAICKRLEGLGDPYGVPPEENLPKVRK
jgi:hypothetical protein